MGRDKERFFRDFFNLLQSELKKEFEKAKVQNELEPYLTYVSTKKLLQRIENATVPYCPTTCVSHY